MSWFTRKRTSGKRKTLKNETLKKRSFQRLRNFYTNTKSGIRNFFEARKAKKEGRAFHPTMKAKESRERLKKRGDDELMKKLFKNVFREPEKPLTPANLNAKTINITNFERNIEIGDKDLYCSKSKSEYNALSAAGKRQYRERCVDYLRTNPIAHVENIFARPITPPVQTRRTYRTLRTIRENNNNNNRKTKRTTQRGTQKH